MERDCKNCIRSKGVTEYDNGCTAWECDYINRKEAIEVWKAYKNGELVPKQKELKGE